MDDQYTADYDLDQYEADYEVDQYVADYVVGGGLEADIRDTEDDVVRATESGLIRIVE